jgi:predicted TPR repeat methyltransferase
MLDDIGTHAVPHVWSEIEKRTAELGFDMPSDTRTGALLKALAASKPHGRLLELGTGTGLATACPLAGMDSASQLVSVDIDAQVQAVARDLLGSDTVYHSSWLTAKSSSVLSRTSRLISCSLMPGVANMTDLTMRLLSSGAVASSSATTCFRRAIGRKTTRNALKGL